MDYKLLGGIFLEGVLSFLSPCVLPLIPLYMTYLAGDNKQSDEEGNVHYDKAKVFITTLFFVLGISLTFVLLTASLKTIAGSINKYAEIISIIGGTLLIVFGLHELGIIHIDLLNKELKLKMDLHLEKMNYLKAFILGFVFSLGWSPCIGPLLSNAILLAATDPQGYIYIIVYALGLIIPFIITGLFTTSVLNLINKNKKILNYVLKIAGIVLILFGIYMIHQASEKILIAKELETTHNSQSSTENMILDYEFVDEKGNKIRLSDYKGKYLFLNFMTTWCTYCEMERPEYIKFAENEDIKCLYVISPLNEYDGMESINKYLNDNEIPITTLIDTEGSLFYYCGISGYPTIYVVDPDGEFLAYASGVLDLEGFNGLYDYAKELYENKQ